MKICTCDNPDIIFGFLALFCVATDFIENNHSGRRWGKTEKSKVCRQLNPDRIMVGIARVEGDVVLFSHRLRRFPFDRIITHGGANERRTRSVQRARDLQVAARVVLGAIVGIK